jgi:hypothetical protein
MSYYMLIDVYPRLHRFIQLFEKVYENILKLNGLITRPSNDVVSRESSGLLLYNIYRNFILLIF